MNVDFVERLVRRLEQSGLSGLEYSDGTIELRLRMTPPPEQGSPDQAVPAAPPSPEAVEAVCARTIGILRLNHPGGARPPQASAARAVKAGDVVAFLEAGPILRPVVVDRDCTIGEPLAADGSLIGYGTPLFPLI